MNRNRNGYLLSPYTVFEPQNIYMPVVKVAWGDSSAVGVAGL